MSGVLVALCGAYSFLNTVYTPKTGVPIGAAHWRSRTLKLLLFCTNRLHSVSNPPSGLTFVRLVNAFAIANILHLFESFDFGAELYELILNLKEPRSGVFHRRLLSRGVRLKYFVLLELSSSFVVARAIGAFPLGISTISHAEQ